LDECTCGKKDDGIIAKNCTFDQCNNGRFWIKGTVLVYSRIYTSHSSYFDQYLDVAFFVVDQGFDAAFDHIFKLDFAGDHFLRFQIP
jgi:hypothetical protein